MDEKTLISIKYLLGDIPNNAEILIEADVNARIGVRDRAEYEQTLGPHGIPGRNTRGANLLEIYGTHRLRVENTFFQHSNYTTYVSKGDDKMPSMHDVFVAAGDLHRRIRDCKTVDDGIDSNHAAVAIKLAITSIKFKGRAISRGTVNWEKILTGEYYLEVYNQNFKSMVTDDMSYDDFNGCIIKAGELTALIVKKKCEGWFQFNRD